MNLKGNKSEKSLSLRLADGKEKSFRDGYEMWKWYMKHRSAPQGYKKSRHKKAKKTKT
tara:strand:- start:663 stop:836 length:174 start_codon:yes stop_codon:yes gene_type:complete